MEYCSKKYHKPGIRIVSYILNAIMWGFILLLAWAWGYLIYLVIRLAASGEVTLAEPYFWYSLLERAFIGALIFWPGFYTFFSLFGNSALLLRKFRIDRSGITIREYYGLQKFYSWDKISCVVLCDCNTATKHPEWFMKAIRLSIGEEPRGPIGKKEKKRFWNQLETWRFEDYMGLHFRKIIVLDYSKERFAQIEQMSGIKAINRRSEYGLKEGGWE